MKFSYKKKKIKIIKWVIKQLVELYKDNNKLLLGKLILLQDDCKVTIFLFSRDIQKL